MNQIETLDDVVRLLHSGAIITYYSYAPNEFDVDWQYEINGKNINDEKTISTLSQAFDDAKEDFSYFATIDLNEYNMRLVLR